MGRRQKSGNGFFLWASDWLASESILDMTLAQEGLYTRMLARASTNGGKLPSDVRALARKLGRQESEVREAWTAPLVDCWDDDGEGSISNPKLLRELERVDRYAAAGSRGGTNAAQSRCSDSAASGAAMVQPSSSSSSLAPSSSGTRGGAKAPDAVATAPRPSRKKPTGAHHEFLAWWCEAWEEARGSAYVVQGGKDGAAVKAALKYAKDDLGELKRRAGNLLASEDAWTAENASLPLLSSRWNQLDLVPGSLQRKRREKQGSMDWLDEEVQKRTNGGGAAEAEYEVR